MRRATPGSNLLLAKVRRHSAKTSDCPCGIVDKQGDKADLLPRNPFLARRVNGSLLSVRDDTTKCPTTLDEEPRRTGIVSEWATMQELRNFGLHNGVNDGVSSLLSCEPSAEVNGAALSTT